MPDFRFLQRFIDYIFAASLFLVTFLRRRHAIGRFSPCRFLLPLLRLRSFFVMPDVTPIVFSDTPLPPPLAMPACH